MMSEARFYFIANVLILLVIDGTLIGACVFAWIKGRAAERYGATIYFLSALASSGFELLTGQDFPIVPTLLFDTLVAVTFLALAVRYNSLWLGAAMMIKGMQLALHAMHLTDTADHQFAGGSLYAWSLNGVSLGISLTIIGGTIASVHARGKARTAHLGGAVPRPG